MSVVGESQNTAKYIGISVPKVIIRTMVLSGALAGVAGWLLVAGTSYTISTSSAGGMGFTAILVAWLAGLNPVAMVLTSILVQFFSIGAEFAGSNFGFGTAFPEIIKSVFFFVVIASEFFTNYQVKLSPELAAKFKRKKKTVDSNDEPTENVENIERLQNDSEDNPQEQLCDAENVTDDNIKSDNSNVDKSEKEVND